MDSFGSFLREKRRQKGLSLQGLSNLLSEKREKIGWYPERSRLSLWETGKAVPSIKHRPALLAMAKILDMEPTEESEWLVKAGLAPLQTEELDMSAIDSTLSSMGERRRKAWFLNKYLGWDIGRISSKLKAPSWDIQRDIEEVKDELEKLVGKVEDLPSVATQLKAQLFLPAPETLLINDFGGLGRHSIQFRRDVFKIVSKIGYDISEFWVTKEDWMPPGEIPPDLEIEVVVSPSALGLSFPLEEHPLLQKLFSEAAQEKVPIWKKEGGRYLTMCHDIYREIRTEARNRTFQSAWEDAIRIGRPPLTPNFGDLIYQLAILHRCSPSKFPIPDRELYQIRRRSLLFSELYLGLIHLANAPELPPPPPGFPPPPSFLNTWANIHRDMIIKWGASPAIIELLKLFDDLRRIEAMIKQELDDIIRGK